MEDGLFALFVIILIPVLVTGFYLLVWGVNYTLYIYEFGAVKGTKKFIIRFKEKYFSKKSN